MAKIFKSSVINAPIENVWSKIRDFNALPDWHPSFTDSHIENGEPSDKVGCIRIFKLQDSNIIKEKLLTLSDLEHICTYTILESPLPMVNYVATLRLLPITDGNQTYIEWTAEFICLPEIENNLVKTIGEEVFQSGFNGLKLAIEK